MRRSAHAAIHLCPSGDGVEIGLAGARRGRDLWKTKYSSRTGPGTVSSSRPRWLRRKIGLVADGAVTLHRARKTQVGVGEVLQNTIGANANFTTDSSIIPFLLLGVGEKHGAYMGFEWELGGFHVVSAANLHQFTVSVFPVTENVTRLPGTMFAMPAVYYGTYQGGLDDGANRFKRWFWNHKITHSLHDNKDEPWSEVCMQDVSSPSGNASVVGTTPQSVYDRLAATGVECVKMDFWDGSGKCWYTDRDWMFHLENWPHGFDYHRQGSQGRTEGIALHGRNVQGCRPVDHRRTRRRVAGGPDAVRSGLVRHVANRSLYGPQRPDARDLRRRGQFPVHPGSPDRKSARIPLRELLNGGKLKGFAICRRMTYCTMNDDDQTPWRTRTTYYSNTYAINPVQLKSDIGAGPNVTTNLRTAIMGPILTWAFDTPEYRRYIALYKERQRPILRGANVYHILPMADGVHWDGMQFYNPDIKRGSVLVFKPGTNVPPNETVRLKGLNPRGCVHADVRGTNQGLNCVRTGSQLMANGIYVSGMIGANASEIIWIEETPRSAADAGA